MARIPEKVRGLYLVAPHGTLLATGEKRAVVKARKFKMAGEWLAILEDQRLLGVAKFKPPKPLTVEEFNKTYDLHRVSPEERIAWWMDKRKLWLYPVDEVYAYPSPIEYDVPPGTQTFLKGVILPNRDKLVKVEPIEKLELRRFRAEGVDYDLEHPKARRAELQADLRYLAVGYDRLKRGLKWGDWRLKDILRYFGTIVDTLREKVNPAYFPEPPAGDPKWKTNWWRCYKEAKEKGYLKTEPREKAKQAALGLVYRDGEILLIKRKNEPRVWSPPGGFLSGRDPVTAALKEVQEETGVLADPVMNEPWREITVDGVRLHLVPMRWIKGKGEPLAEAEEVGWFKLDELPEPISPPPDTLRAGQAIAKDGLGEAKLREMFEKLPDAFVVVPDWASLTGSAIYGKNRKPHDIDIVLRLDAPSGSLLKLERALKEAIGEGLPVQFSLEAQGPTWAYLPLYTLVAVKNPEFEIRSLPEPGFAERFYKAAVQENISKIKPLEPVAHYKAAGEFYGGEEEELWEKWARRAVERGEKIAVQAKADGFRLHIHKKGSESAVFTEKGLERSAAFPDFPKLIEKLPCRECILDVEAMAYKDSEWRRPQNRWEMAWIGSAKEPHDEPVTFWAHDILWLDGKNVCGLPYLERLKLLRKLIGDSIVAGKLKLAVMPTKVATGKRGLLAALKWADSQRQCNSEGAMLKFLSFKYDTGVLGGVVKYKTVPELDTLAIGWRKVPAGKPPHVHWTREQAFKELPKLLEKSNTYIFRCALRSEEDPNLWLPLEGDHELSESDLKLDWDEEKQTWKGTDDPKYWTMLPGWPERKAGELAYGNTYACKIEDPSWLKKGLVITVRAAELRPFKGEDGKWHISWQHPLSPNPKEPGSPIGSVEAALRAYKLDPKDFQPLAWRKWKL